MTNLTLSEQDVSDSCINVIIGRFTAVDHQTIHKLHGFGSLATQFSRNDYFTSFGTTLHDEAKNAIACPETKL